MSLKASRVSVKTAAPRFPDTDRHVSANSSRLEIDASHALLQPDCRDRVVLLPHIGSGTMEARRAMADRTINNLLGALGVRGEAGKEHTMDSEL